MKTQPHNLDDAWQGLEPEQPRSRGGGFWVALLAAFFLLAGVGLLAAYLLGRAPDEPDEPVAETAATGQPTSAAEQSASPDEGGAAGGEEASPPATLAPAATATLPGSLPETGVLTVPRLTVPLTIDGLLNDWEIDPLTASTFQVFAAPGWDGTDDMEAIWRLAWDENALYVGVTVTDDIHVQTQTGNTIFRGDSVDLQFDTDRAVNPSPVFGPDDFQLTISPGDFAALPPQAFLFQGTSNGRMLDASTQGTVTVAALPTGNGYTLEAAVPWTTLNLTPVPGIVIGVALNASDNDQPGTTLQEVMKSHIPGRTFSDPTTWGTLVLGQ